MLNLDRVEFDVRGVGGVEGGEICLPIIEGVEGGDTTGGVKIGAVVLRGDGENGSA